MQSAKLPIALLESLQGVTGFDREAFVQVHESGAQVTSVRLNPAKPVNSEWSIVNNIPDDKEVGIHHSPLTIDPIPWSSQGYYLSQRPFFTFDPLFHAGVYYVQEASSMFVEQALKQTTDLSQPLRVLDLCAAPGGKSTLLQSLISENSLLVSNEVIKSRAGILDENLTKWGAINTIVTNNDPKDLAQLHHFFDVIVVDAPCSGSGLFRRDPDAIQEWSEQNVQLCHQRQQRILADIYPALKPGGVLIYSTCSYSKEEDEEITDWLINEQEATSLPLTIDASWGIVETRSEEQGAYGYRFFPDKVKGEGFFIACFRKADDDAQARKLPKRSKLQKLSKAEDAIVRPWLKADAPVQLWKQGELIIAFPQVLEQELLQIADIAYIRKAGVLMGKIAGKDLVPDHALAVSTIVNGGIVAISLKKEDALQYLRREEVMIASPQKGWALIQYQQINLGWVKLLGNRVNNYYPSNWRILKSANN
ncbi:MAG: RNA methyltransferase [Chitinophagaceae bacterium]